jgi:hypothetical protein
MDSVEEEGLVLTKFPRMDGQSSIYVHSPGLQPDGRRGYASAINVFFFFSSDDDGCQQVQLEAGLPPFTFTTIFIQLQIDVTHGQGIARERAL